MLFLSCILAFLLLLIAGGVWNIDYDAAINVKSYHQCFWVDNRHSHRQRSYVLVNSVVLFDFKSSDIIASYVGALGVFGIYYKLCIFLACVQHFELDFAS
ncbi:hypothetical protein VPNG_05179 [Cytospora leucostoma]|uniref:Uncharacterized protein n=1 Tax=Cytospora leucostoma TaxID=1230097 RepID=A0A423X812_9PEZI|nr:hypothetical protein VPNG_05179 [Cytospora leucostoma]